MLSDLAVDPAKDTLSIFLFLTLQSNTFSVLVLRHCFFFCLSFIGVTLSHLVTSNRVLEKQVKEQSKREGKQ